MLRTKRCRRISNIFIKAHKSIWLLNIEFTWVFVKHCCFQSVQTNFHIRKTDVETNVWMYTHKSYSTLNLSSCLRWAMSEDVHYAICTSLRHRRKDIRKYVPTYKPGLHVSLKNAFHIGLHSSVKCNFVNRLCLS